MLMHISTMHDSLKIAKGKHILHVQGPRGCSIDLLVHVENGEVFIRKANTGDLEKWG